MNHSFKDLGTQVLGHCNLPKSPATLTHLACLKIYFHIPLNKHIFTVTCFFHDLNLKNTQKNISICRFYNSFTFLLIVHHMTAFRQYGTCQRYIFIDEIMLLLIQNYLHTLCLFPTYRIKNVLLLVTLIDIEIK